MTKGVVVSQVPQQTELAVLTIGQAAKLLQTRPLSPVELTRAIDDPPEDGRLIEHSLQEWP